MAKLYGLVRGNRGEATRLGSDRLTTRAQGWDSGVTVEAHADSPELREYIISENGGSNGSSGSVALGVVKQDVASGRVRFVLSSALAEALNANFPATGGFRGGDHVTLKPGWGGD